MADLRQPLNRRARETLPLRSLGGVRILDHAYTRERRILRADAGSPAGERRGRPTAGKVRAGACSRVAAGSFLGSHGCGSAS